ncbi:GntR family transcriptional regulator [Rhodoplanes roseus]|uniref:HTH gntR-type domain-containing protein n=1 Tax=Rhodoplanes roseus TaxID=29409 RepID=A0A327L157_9BRAD|nr:GntR family transcriptional regulator [Rhodoplanes roseus]RAI44206.1 hypothetical protein CH341_10375 [Rhodoplanes roseus]
MPSARSPFDPLWVGVADPLRSAIVEGRLAPGKALSENQLAAEYGVSRTPVREALRLLMEEGLVEMLPGRKVRVAVPRPSDVREVYDVRAVLEAEAVRRLLKTEETARRVVAEMERACDVSDAALARDDLTALAAANARFHAALVSALGNRRLLADYETIYNLVALYRHQSLRIEYWAEAGNAEHRALLDRLRRGDEAAAIDLLRAHIERACALVCRRYEQAPAPVIETPGPSTSPPETRSTGREDSP